MPMNKEFAEELYSSLYEPESKPETNGDSTTCFENATLVGVSRHLANRIMDSEDKLTLVNVIEALEKRLTSKIVTDRVTALELLSSLFLTFHVDFLNEKELEFIGEFLHDRLRDQHLVIPFVIESIWTIVRNKNFPKGLSSKLLSQLFAEANIQSHPHKVRKSFYLLLQYILQDKILELKEDPMMKTDLIMNFLQSVDGEKDPRNLLIIFSIVPNLLDNFPLEPFTEDFFEVLSCYFPIDFTPTSGSKEVITRDEISISLEEALSHTRKFAPFLIPIAIEKLDSSFEDSKVDSFKLLSACCKKSYRAEDLNDHMASIWHALRREIFMGGSERVEREALRFISFASKALSSNEGILEKSITLIYSECKHHISDPELLLGAAATRILASLCNGGIMAAKLVLSKSIPLLYDEFVNKTNSLERKKLLELISLLVEGTFNSFPNAKFREIIPNWDELTSTMFSLLSSSDVSSGFPEMSLKFFSILISHEDFSKKERDLIQEHYLNLLEKQLNSEITSIIIKIMNSLIKRKSDEFIDTSVKRFKEKKESCNENFYITFSAACGESLEVSEQILPIYFANDNLNLSSMEVQFIDKVIEIGSTNIGTKLILFIANTLRGIEKLTRFALEQNKKMDTLFEPICKILRMLMRNLPALDQQNALDSFLIIYYQDQMTSALLTESIVGPLKTLIKYDENQMFKSLITRVEEANSNCEIETLSSTRLLACLINKSSEDVLEDRLKTIYAILPEESLYLNKNGSKCLFWIVKGLAMRGYQNLDIWIERAINLLRNDKGSEMAKNFAILVADDEFSLNQESFCNFRFLYKQRIFASTASKLVSAYRSGDVKNEKFRQNYIQALTVQLPHIPNSVITMEINNVIPILVASLHCEQEVFEEGKAGLINSTLTALEELLSQENRPKLNDYCGDLTPKLVKLSNYSHSMDVRILALKCLRKCAKFPTHLIFPLKLQVIKDMKKSLDDIKRLVRKEAALTRNVWILIDAPGGI